MEYQDDILINGSRILTFCNPYLHRVNIGFYFRGGSAYENSQINGISHLLEHLFFRRLHNLNQKALYDQVNRMGASFRGATYSDCIRFDITVTQKSFQEAFDILTNILSEFTWSAEEIESEKEVVKRQIQFSPYNSFSRQVNTLYFSGTNQALSIMGTIETVHELSSDTIHAWKHKIFHPSNLLCVLTGNFTDQDYQYAKRQLEKMTTQNSVPEKHSIVPAGFCNRTHQSDYMDPCGWNPAEVILTFDADHVEISPYSLTLLSSVIGEGDGSILSMLLREENGLTDEVYACVDVYQELSKLQIEFSVDNKRLLLALEILFQKLKQIKENLTTQDFETSIRFFTDPPSFYDDVRELNFYLAWRKYILETEFIPDLVLQHYQNLSLNDLQDAARKLLSSHNLVVSVAYNKQICKRKDLEKKIEELRRFLQ